MWGLDTVPRVSLNNYLPLTEMCHQTCLGEVWGSERRRVPIGVAPLRAPVLMHLLAKEALTTCCFLSGQSGEDSVGLVAFWGQ